MNFSHYLPQTEKRLDTLRRIINKRPVAIMSLGFSLTELEARVTELKDCDICYCSISRFWVVEKYILSRINQNLSIVMCSADPSFQSYGVGTDYILDFLKRQQDNIFISTMSAFEDNFKVLGTTREAILEAMNKYVQEYDKKLLFHYTMFNEGASLFREVPTEEYPLHFQAYTSLMIIIALMVIGGASKIVLFGADGGGPYYRQDELHNIAGEDRLAPDVENFNKHTLDILQRVCKIYDLMSTDSGAITNCSPQSRYGLFPKLSYDESFAWLKER